MRRSTSSPEIELLLFTLDRAYERKSWHGANLRGSIRGIRAAQAAWRPGSGRRSIADHTVHAAYWKYTVQRRLTAAPRGAFPLKGSNWIKLAEPLTEPQWRQYVRLLDTCHRDLRDHLAKLPANRLNEIPPGAKVTNLEVITGIIAHDLYHAGQIQLLKRLWKQRRGA